MRTVFGLSLLGIVVSLCAPVPASAAKLDPAVRKSVTKGLDWLVSKQNKKQGYWEANGGQYRVAMTALAGNALLCEGSTTTRGKYAKNVRLAVDYLVELAKNNPQKNGLIGYKNDYHYTYGHGYSMLFLSQVFGEEEDAQRREELKQVLTKAVQFCGEAQTTAGGWGYVSAKDGNDFDEGSTCVTQVQGLRACRNAGIPVPKEVVDRAVEYIKKCTTPEGGVQYSIKGGGSRPPITAAAVACMFNAGEYSNDYVKKLLAYCKSNLSASGEDRNSFGHWHYAHYYYAQVLYRQGGDEWKAYYGAISKNILRKQSHDGSWQEGHVGPVYTTAINATILQLENGFLPIYQK